MSNKRTTTTTTTTLHEQQQQPAVKRRRLHGSGPIRLPSDPHRLASSLPLVPHNTVRKPISFTEAKALLTPVLQDQQQPTLDDKHATTHKTSNITTTTTHHHRLLDETEEQTRHAMKRIKRLRKLISASIPKGEHAIDEDKLRKCVLEDDQLRLVVGDAQLVYICNFGAQDDLVKHLADIFHGRPPLSEELTSRLENIIKSCRSHPR